MVLVAALAFAPALLTPMQTGRVFPTIEAIVGNCESVCIGAIQDIEFSEPGDGFKTMGVKFKVKVQESLKGTIHTAFELDFPTRFTAETLGLILKRGTQFLFVSPPENPTLREDISRKMVGINHETKLPVLWFRLYESGSMDRYVDYDSNLFSADLRVISSMPDLLREARNAAKKYPKNIELTGFAMPHVVTQMCGDPNAFGYLVIPKDEGAKTLLRSLVADPAKVIRRARSKSKRVYKEPKPTSADLDELRRIGERALKEFDPKPTHQNEQN